MNMSCINYNNTCPIFHVYAKQKQKYWIEDTINLSDYKFGDTDIITFST